MSDNPFIITEKVKPEYFCDRQEESRQMLKLLGNGNNVVLISQRRIGKTSLIQYCYQREDIRDDYFTIYVDILSTTNLKEFTYLLGREIFEAVRTRGEKRWQSFLMTVKSLAAKVGFDSMTGLPSLNFQLGDIVKPEYTLKEIFEFLSHADKPCILAIDEFQQINKYPESNVAALIRSHLLQINNCRMIFAGSQRHLLADMFMNSSQPFYLSASFVELAPIPRDLYCEFIVAMFEKFGKKISQGLAFEVYDLFDGITFNVQRVCNGLFSNTAPGGEADSETLVQTLDETLSSYDVIFRMRMGTLTMRQKELLLAVAREGCVAQITSAQFVKRNSLASAATVQTAVKSLVEKDILAKTEHGYVVDDRFFRLWLNRNY